MIHHLNIISSVLSSTLRAWHGSAGSKSVTQPPQAIILFDNENNPECRLVREALTELNLDVLIYPCPKEAKRFTAQLQQYGTSYPHVPFLVDANFEVTLQGAAAIIRYLFQQYKQDVVPKHLEVNTRNLLTSRLASMARLRAEICAKASREPQKPLILYSFESSPYSRPVREKLCELQLPYQLINLGKQQFADIGLASFRFHLGEYRPLANSKRAQLLAQKGRVQVPFLIDPNQGVELLESKDILEYLDKTYAL